MEETAAPDRSRLLDRAADVGVVLLAVGGGLLRDVNRIEPLRADGAAPQGYLLDLPWQVLVLAHVVGALLLLPRRRYSYAVGLVLAALAAVTPVWAAGLAPYAVARYGPRPSRSVVVNVLLVTGSLVGSGVLGRLGGNGDPSTILVVVAALTGFGLYFRARAEVVAQLLARAEAAERERGLLAEQARAQERLRLATHLHDEVTRSATVVVLQAGALTVSAPTAPAREVAEQLRVSGARVLDDLQRLVRVLAAEDDGVRPAGPPPAASVREVLDDCGVRGVVLDERGDASGVAPQQVSVLHDVVREAVVNAGKHAAGAGVRVEVAWGDPATVQVRDDGGRARAGVGGTGLGLRSLRERVESAGGRFEAGPVGAGFELRAELPRHETPRPAREPV